MKPAQEQEPIEAVVSWENLSAGPIVTPDDIPVEQGRRNVPIRWRCGKDVARLEITGLPPGVFNPGQSNGMVPNFTTTDANRVREDYKYTVGATRVTGEVAYNDPRIRNGG
jgi:hypothetical protein